jgi:hypothetical protein
VKAVAQAVRGVSICGLARTGREDVERAARALEGAARRASTPSSRRATSTCTTSCA